MYDLIGDIHGHADELEALLKKLGYVHKYGCYRHSERKAVFVGDLIDRGPGIQKTLHMVRAMVEQDAALAVMGNHEFNALAYHTPDPDSSGEYLRPQNKHNNKQHKETLEQVDDIDSMLQFFWSLPVWLDLLELRVVHACWDHASVQHLDSMLDEQRLDQTSLLGSQPQAHRDLHRHRESAQRQ